MNIKKQFAQYVINGVPLQGFEGLTYFDGKLYLARGDLGLEVYDLKDEMETGIE